MSQGQLGPALHSFPIPYVPHLNRSFLPTWAKDRLGICLIYPCRVPPITGLARHRKELGRRQIQRRPSHCPSPKKLFISQKPKAPTSGCSLRTQGLKSTAQWLGGLRTGDFTFLRTEEELGTLQGCLWIKQGACHYWHVLHSQKVISS